MWHGGLYLSLLQKCFRFFLQSLPSSMIELEELSCLFVKLVNYLRYSLVRNLKFHIYLTYLYQMVTEKITAFFRNTVWNKQLFINIVRSSFVVSDNNLWRDRFNTNCFLVSVLLRSCFTFKISVFWNLKFSRYYQIS